MNAKQYLQAADQLPDTIEAALRIDPIQEMLRYISPMHLRAVIGVELARLAGRIKTSGNLDPDLLDFISGQLMTNYPAESLADFKICFQRGAMGAYGKVWRLDGAIIGEWMEKYLSEKYKAVEAAYEAQKAYEKERPTPPADPGPGYEEFRAWAKKLNEEMNTRSNTPRPESEPRWPRHGEERPAATGYRLTAEQIKTINAEQDARLIEGRRRYWKEKYPNTSEADIDNLMNNKPTP